ncbi:MAG TPA: hypothetical protein VF258_05900, partial [Luteolibacter sp.]
VSLGAVVVFAIKCDWISLGASSNPAYGKTVSSNPVEKHDSPRSAPRAGFDRTLDLLARGGTPLQIGDATGFLDEITRSGIVLETDRRAMLLAALEQGNPEGMGEGDWSHLFNNACNVLAVGQTSADGRFLALLEKTANDDPRLVMRLYALQHLGVAYDHADAESRKRLEQLVRRILTDPDAQTAGTALELWRKWEKTATPGEDTSTDISRALVTDATRPVDVRVTALHAIGDDPKVIDLARGIAPDHSQPVILRKVAICLIGRHGGERDLSMLRDCTRQNPRLAQAGEPAVRMLEGRLAGKADPTPVPF